MVYQRTKANVVKLPPLPWWYIRLPWKHSSYIVPNTFFVLSAAGEVTEQTIFEMSGRRKLPRNVKVKAVNNLLRLAPPGEFTCVFNDVRLLANDDKLMHELVSCALSQHNKDNFTPVVKSGLEVLLTRHNDLGNCRFFDPDKKVSFHYCHLTRKVRDFEPYCIDGEEDESWRKAFQASLKEYVKSHFSSGICSVYRTNLRDKKIFVACIEAHRFNPWFFKNGKWRSEWMFDLTPPVTNAMGNIIVQAHYYENGNVHLSAGKSVEEMLFLNSKEEAAKDFTQLVEKADSEFQTALMKEYNGLSDKTLKSLRRQLPVTHSLLDWNKIASSSAEDTDAVALSCPIEQYMMTQ